MIKKLLSIISYAIKPSMFFVMIAKFYRRFFDEKATIKQDEYIEWLDSKGVNFSEWSNELSNDLYEEALEFADYLYRKAQTDLVKNPYDMGGGGLVHVIYFITRYFKPSIIVETGVASGFSSESILRAMNLNNKEIHK